MSAAAAPLPHPAQAGSEEGERFSPLRTYTLTHMAGSLTSMDTHGVCISHLPWHKCVAIKLACKRGVASKAPFVSLHQRCSKEIAAVAVSISACVVSMQGQFSQ